jgi:putative spermidine/putrescine transport system permease protein
MRSSRLGRLGTAVFVSAVCTFLVLPTLIVVPMSFTRAEQLIFPPVGFSLRWYASYVTETAWRVATLNSFVVGAGATVLATLLGTMAALAIARGRIPFRGALTTLFLFPMIVPSIVVAVAIYNTFARLGLSGTVAGMILAHTILALPFVVINVLAVLQKMDWRIVDAARSLGATPAHALFLVTLPAIMPGVIAGALFAFVTSFDEVVVALFLSGTAAATLPVQMWNGIRFEINPTVAAVSVVVIVFTSVVFTLISALQRVPK